MEARRERQGRSVRGASRAWAPVLLCVLAAGGALGGSLSARPAARAQQPLRCNPQDPLPFLVRGNYVDLNGISRQERRARRLLHKKAIEYRTRQYGWFPGFGHRYWNPHAPADSAVHTTFFGLDVRMHERVVPALSCVETEIRSACAAEPYQPEILRGIRGQNTFDERSGEVSNHVYGIAIDIDGHRNVCCGCMAGRNAPPCTREVSSIYERMEMPECWVHAFERYGFYWLGHDALMDMMHFEFLGDPDRIVAE